MKNDGDIVAASIQIINSVDTLWCCIRCSWKGRFGDLLATDIMRCPNCNNGGVDIADGGSYSTPIWNGPRPAYLN